MPTEVEDWNPLGAEALSDPITDDRTMRQTCPVAYTDAYGGFYGVFRHEDIVAVTRDRDTFISAPTISVPVAPDGGPPWLPLQSDGVDHRRYRKVLTPFFAATRMLSFEPDLRRMTNELIDGFIDRGSADLAAELCYTLPAMAICKLMGLPEEDWHKLDEWTFESISAGARGDGQERMRIYGEMLEYADAWIDRRTAEPGTDVISAMTIADIDGRRMTRSELHGMFLLLAEAGHETTANALVSSLHHLAGHPEQRRWLAAQPEVPDEVIEELLRFTAPVRALARTATQDTEVGGRSIPKGAHVVLMFASGSRDETVFENPDVCDFGRDASNHTTFGKGIHRCIGEHLARLEIRIVLGEFLRRIPDFQLDGDPAPAMWPNIGYRSLPVSFDVPT